MADVAAVGASSSSAAPPRVTARAHRRLGRLGVYAFLTAGALVFLLPYVWMVSASLKPEAEVFQAGLNLVPREVRWQNYADAWRQYPLGRWLLNTFLVASVETVSTVVTSVLAGFAFARLRFWGRDQLFYLYLGAMMVPIQVTLIPSFIIVRQLGLLNTYEGIAIIHLVQFFGVFLMRQFLLNIPSELEDAARIDGCSRFGAFLRVVLPLSAPGLAACGVIMFILSWHELLVPLVVSSRPEAMTVPVILAGLVSDFYVFYTLMMTISLVGLLPTVALVMLLQRYVVRGLTSGALKG
jgi:ABC-type glycerol-3-phosphate transport system permease component